MLRFNNDCLQTRNVKVVVRVIMVSLLSHCEINFSCFIEALDSKGILRTLKKVLRQPDNVLTLQVSVSLCDK